EDGIRDFHVTGVQTCALPIYRKPRRGGKATDGNGLADHGEALDALGHLPLAALALDLDPHFVEVDARGERVEVLVAPVPRDLDERAGEDAARQRLLLV